MRVLLLNQSFYPDQTATAVQLRDLARHLRDLGHEVTVMSARRAYSQPEIKHSRSEVHEGIRIIRLPSTGFGKRSFVHRMIDGLTFELSLLWRLLFFARQDLVIGFTSPPLIGFVAWLFCRLRGGRCTQWMMDINPDIAFEVGYLKPDGPLGRFLTGLLRFSVRHSDHIVVLDRWMRQKLLSHGAAAEQIVVVPPWPISETPLACPEKGKVFRARHGIGASFVVLFSGNHSVAHPLDTLLEAAKRLRDDPEVLFLFIGGGLRARDVTCFKEHHGLENILQLPHQPTEVLPESLSSGDLHVVPMGPGMSGLLHTSKIYGVLATGQPYLFIGPPASHVADLLADCPYGYQAMHGDADGVVDAIARARALTEQERALIREHNTRYAAEQCSVEGSLAEFTDRVLFPDRGPVGLPQMVQLPSRT